MACMPSVGIITCERTFFSRPHDGPPEIRWSESRLPLPNRDSTSAGAHPLLCRITSPFLLARTEPGLAANNPSKRS